MAAVVMPGADAGGHAETAAERAVAKYKRSAQHKKDLQTAKNAQKAADKFEAYYQPRKARMLPQERKAMESRLTSLRKYAFATLSVQGSPKSTKLILKAGNWKKEMPLPSTFRQLCPGTYMLQSQLSNYKPKQQAVTLSASQSQTVVINLVPKPKEKPKRPVPPSEEQPAITEQPKPVPCPGVIGWTPFGIVVALAGASLATGIGTHTASSQNYVQMYQQAYGGAEGDINASKQTGDTLATTASTTYIAAGALGATAIALLIVQVTQQQRQKKCLSQREKAAVPNQQHTLTFR